jgi:hypothetical protein
MDQNALRLAILRARAQGDAVSKDIVKLMEAAEICQGIPGGTVTIMALKSSAQVLAVKLQGIHASMNTLDALRREMQEA